MYVGMFSKCNESSRAEIPAKVNYRPVSFLLVSSKKLQTGYEDG